MGDNRKKKKYYFRKSNKNKYFLEPGYKGFFGTCNFREKDSIKEAYNLLNEYAVRLYPNIQEEESGVAENAQNETEINSEEQCDISEVLKRDLEKMKKESQKPLKDKRFQAVETGASNCIFIKTNLPDPEVLSTSIMKDLLSNKTPKTRHLLRLVPIMSTCKANLPDIMECAGKLFDKYFLKNPSTFAVVFNKRFNSNVSREMLIKELADLVVMKNGENKADLKNPHYSIIIEIIKGICLVSVVENYYEYKKYNLHEICKNEKTEDETQTKKLIHEICKNEKTEDETQTKKLKCDSTS